MTPSRKLKEIIQKAEQIIEDFEIDESKIDEYNDESGEDLSVEQLRKMFKQAIVNYIDINSKVEYKGDTHIPLGSSKLYGLPHLPDSINFPEDQVFFAQINLSDIAECDANNVFPEKGIIYFFGDYYGDGACSTYYYDGPMDALKIKEYPKSEYLEASSISLFMKNNRLEPIEFSRYSGGISFDFTMAGCDNDPIIDIAEKLEKVLKKELGNDISDPTYDCYLLGSPTFWQEEEEDFNPDTSKLIFCIGYEDGNYNYFVRAENGIVNTDEVFIQDGFDSYAIYSGT